MIMLPLYQEASKPCVSCTRELCSASLLASLLLFPCFALSLENFLCGQRTCPWD